MNRIAPILLALALFAPLAAAAQSTLKNTIPAGGMVIYEPMDGQTVLVPGLKTARVWSDPLIQEAGADCESRNGALNRCAAVCGLNGCFSTCALACELPSATVTEPRSDEEAERRYTASRMELSVLADAIQELNALAAASAWRTDTLRALEATLGRKETARLASCEVAKQIKKGTLALNYFNEKQPLMLAYCDSETPDIRVHMGDGNPHTLIYSIGYAITNGVWKPVSLTARENTNGPWIVGDATLRIEQTATEAPVDAVAMYMCQSVAGAWKCGCQDASCAKPKWQVMGIR